MLSTSPRRVAVVVHPTRPVDEALRALGRWAGRHGIDVVQLEVEGVQREVAAPGKAEPGDLVVALGGDGTVLSALRAAAASDAPVLGVACGSLGALSAVSGEELLEALDRFGAGDWTVRSLPRPGRTRLRRSRRLGRERFRGRPSRIRPNRRRGRSRHFAPARTHRRQSAGSRTRRPRAASRQARPTTVTDMATVTREPSPSADRKHRRCCRSPAPFRSTT
jgi:hypothetical protein